MLICMPTRIIYHLMLYCYKTKANYFHHFECIKCHLIVYVKTVILYDIKLYLNLKTHENK